MIRNILGGFLFSGDDIYKRVSVLSGGERNRLALAKMLLNPSNVLLLDEPTNHLDLDSKEVLLEALADYGGTLIFVSHDRYFVDRLANKVVDVGGGEAMVYPGGYEDFVAWKKAREAGIAAPLPTRDRKPVVHLKEDARARPRGRSRSPRAAPGREGEGRRREEEGSGARAFRSVGPVLRSAGAAAATAAARPPTARRASARRRRRASARPSSRSRSRRRSSRSATSRR